MIENKSMTRQELYELVWSSPVSKLAPKFGISDKGLTKKCKKHKIPTPPLGYWAKVESGKKTIKALLPQNADPVLDVVYFKCTVQTTIQAETDLLEIDRMIVTRAKNFKWPTKVNRYLSVVQEAKSGVGEYTDKYNRIRFKTNLPEFGIRVTKSSLPRVFKFLEGLIRLFKECGWTFIKSDKLYSSKHKTTAAFSDGQVELAFEIKEQVKQVLKKADPKKAYDWDRYEYVPTGILKFTILGIDGSGLRKSWKDSKDERVEDQLESIVVAYAKAFHYKYLRQIELKKKRLELQKQEEVRRELNRFHKVEIKQRENLSDAILKHEEANKIRALVKCIQSKNEITTETQQWMDWALNVAVEIDPISNLSSLIEKHKQVEQSSHNSWGSW